MFNPKQFNKNKKNPLRLGYALHMFESHQNFYNYAQSLLLADNLLDVESNFSDLFKEFLSDQDLSINNMVMVLYQISCIFY